MPHAASGAESGLRARHGRLLAFVEGAVRAADERDPEGRLLQLADQRRVGETRIVAGDLAAGIARLKQEPADGYLRAHGGARFVRSLIATGLIDQYRLLVHPAALGGGEAIFTEEIEIDPIETTAFSGGAVAHVLRPVGRAESAF